MEPIRIVTGHFQACRRYALEEALKAPRPAAAADDSRKGRPDTVEEYKAIERVKGDACIHCHQVYDFPARQALMEAGKWQKENGLGLSVAGKTSACIWIRCRAIVVERIEPGSAAGSAGIEGG